MYICALFLKNIIFIMKTRTIRYVFFLLVYSYASLTAQPANNDCSGATTMVCGDTIFADSTIGATGFSLSSCLGFIGNNVWYKYVGTGDKVTVDVNADPADGMLPQIDILESADGSCTPDSLICKTATGNNGNPVQVEFDTDSGTVYYFRIGHYNLPSVDGKFDISVSCGCDPPGFTVTGDYSTCPDSFSLEVDVSSLGEADSVNIRNSINGDIFSGVDTGTYTFTGFTTPGFITIYVENNTDSTCIDSIIVLTGCPPSNDDCITATTLLCGDSLVGETTIGASGASGTSCIGAQGNTVWYKYTGTGQDVSIHVDGTSAGFVAQIDVLTSGDNSCNPDSLMCFMQSGTGQDPVSVTFTSEVGAVYYIRVGHWLITGNDGDFNIWINCFNCVPPSFDLAGEYTNCPSSVGIDVNVTNLGSAASVYINNNVNGSTASGGLGTHTLTGFALGNTVDVYVTDAADSTCADTMTITLLSGCPPANDLCTGATTIMCGDTIRDSTDFSMPNGGGTGCISGSGIWYAFTGNGQTATVTVDPEVGFDAELAVASSSDCMTFTNISCINTGGNGMAESFTFLAVLNTTYYFYIAHPLDSNTFGTFDISLMCSPCVPPSFTLSSDYTTCPDSFAIHVDVTDLGNASAVNIYNSINTDIFTSVDTGLYTFTGLTGLGPIVVYVENSVDSACLDSMVIYAGCSLVNDDCTGATLMTCGDTIRDSTDFSTTNANPAECTLGPGVWFTFPGNGQTVTVTAAPEFGFDIELYVSSSADCINFTTIDCADDGSDEVVTFTSSIGTTYYFYVGYWRDTTIYGTFDIRLECNDCVPAVFTATPDYSNCLVSVDIDVDVSSVGSADSVIITNNKNGSTAVGAQGLYTLTGFTLGDTVDIYAANIDDTTCVDTATVVLQAGCSPVNDLCANATTIMCSDTIRDSTDFALANGSVTGCIGLGPGVWYTFAGNNQTITVTADPEAGFDIALSVASGTNCSGFTNIDCADGGGDGASESVTFTANMGTTYYFYVGYWKDSTVYGIFDINIECDDCTPPTFTAAPDYTNCPTAAISVDVTNIGNADSVTISNSKNGNTTTGGIGIYSLPGFAPGDTVDVFVANAADPACVDTVRVAFFPGCPPTNDFCADAKTMVCGDTIRDSTDFGVANAGATGCNIGAGIWYTFTGTGQRITVTADPEAGFDIALSVSSTSDCMNFTSIDCIDEEFDGGVEDITFITSIGVTYYFYVGHWQDSTTYGTFDISLECSGCDPPDFTAAIDYANCPDSVNIDIDVTDIGNADSIRISNSLNANMFFGNTGLYTFTGFALGDTVDIYVADADFLDCADTMTVIILEGCPPANDSCNGAAAILCGEMISDSTHFSFANGSVTGCSPIGPGVWYSFTGNDEMVSVTVAPETTFDAKLSIAGSSDCITFTNVDCVDNAVAGGAENSIFNATSGTTYYFYVGYTKDSVAYGAFDIDVVCRPCDPPAASAEIEYSNCPASIGLNVDVSHIGNADSIRISNNKNANILLGGTGMYVLTGFALGDTVEVYVADADFPGCADTLTIVIPLGCPPANDDCAGAASILCGETLSDSTDFSSANGSITGCNPLGPGVWYTFTGGDETVTLTVMPEAGFDIALSVSSSLDCNMFTNVACSDTATAGNMEVITFDALLDTVYYFYIGHANASEVFGSFDINILCQTCEPPQFTATANYANCTMGIDIDVDVTSIGNADSIRITNNINASTAVGGLGMHTLTGFSPGDMVEVYVADADDPTCVDTVTVTLNSSCPPANDQCSGAISIACSQTLTDSTVFATAINAPTCNAIVGAVGLWYTFQGNGDTIRLSTDNAGTNMDTRVQVFSGDCNALTCIESDDNSGTGNTSFIELPTLANTTYYVYVDGAGGATGNFVLSLDCDCPQNLVLSGNSMDMDYVEASNSIQSTQIILAPHTINYDAGFEIELLPGFEVQLGAVFEAFIDGCDN